jgi:hypothetical protein
MDLLIAASAKDVPAERIRDSCRGPVDWHALAELAQLHGTLQLVVANLERAGIAIDPRVAAQVRRNTLRSLLQHRETMRVIGGLTGRGIRCMPYKGTVLAQRLYGKVSQRISSDVDILLEAGALDAAQEVMAGLGYVAMRSMPSDHAHGHELPFVHSELGVVVELQWRPFEEGVAPDGLRWPDSDADLVLLLAWHGLMHRWELLKWISDIDAFCRLTDVDWPAVRRRASELRSGRVLRIAMEVARDLFQTPAPIALEDRTATQIATTLANHIRAGTRPGRFARLAVAWKSRERLRDRWSYLAHTFASEREGSRWLSPLKVLIRRPPRRPALNEAQRLTTWDS